MRPANVSLRKFFGRAVIVAGFRATAFVLGFGVTALLGRVLGPVGYGAYAYAMSWAVVLGVFSVFGTDLLVTREVARARIQGNVLAVTAAWKWANRVVLLASAAASFLAILAFAIVNSSLDPLLAQTLPVAIPFVAVFAFTRLREGMLQGLDRPMLAPLPLLLILPASLIALVLVVHWLSLGPPGAVMAHVVAGAVALAVATIWVRDTLPPSRSRGLEPLQEAPRQWGSSARIFAVTAVIMVINDQVPLLLLGTLSGAEAAGLLSVAQKVSGLVAFALIVINIPLAPLVAKLGASGDREALDRLLARASQVASVSAIALAAAFIGLKGMVLSLFGQGFESAGVALTLLCLAQVFNALMGSVGVVLNMSGYESDTARAVILSVVVNLLVGISLIPSYGVNGAAAASAVALVTWNLYLAVLVRLRVGVNPTAFRFHRWGGHR